MPGSSALWPSLPISASNLRAPGTRAWLRRCADCHSRRRTPSPGSPRIPRQRTKASSRQPGAGPRRFSSASPRSCVCPPSPEPPPPLLRHRQAHRDRLPSNRASRRCPGRRSAGPPNPTTAATDHLWSPRCLPPPISSRSRMRLQKTIWRTGRDPPSRRSRAHPR